MIGKYRPFMGQKLQNNANGSTGRGFVARYTISAADAVAAAVNNVAPVTVLADGLTTTLTITDITQPPTPRVLSITGNAATAVGDVLITGRDAGGSILVETIVSTGANTVIGTKAFASIATIVLPARGAAADSIAVGLVDRFGLEYKLPYDTVLKILNNGVATTVAAGSSFSATVLADNYIDPTAALNAQQVDVYFVV